MLQIDQMQFGFVPGGGTTDATFTARQLQEKHIAYSRPLYCAFVDLEKAFDHVTVYPGRYHCLLSLQVLNSHEMLRNIRLAVEEWAVLVGVSGEYTDKFKVSVGVHQGSVLSPVLFILVLEALSQRLNQHEGMSCELLCVDDLVIMAVIIDECIVRLRI